MKTRLPMIAALAAGLMVAVLPPAVAMAQPSTGTTVQQKLDDLEKPSIPEETLQQLVEGQGRIGELAQQSERMHQIGPMGGYGCADWNSPNCFGP